MDLGEQGVGDVMSWLRSIRVARWDLGAFGTSRAFAIEILEAALVALGCVLESMCSYLFHLVLSECLPLR